MDRAPPSEDRKPAPWRGRRKVDDPKGKFIGVRCTPSEHAQITANAAKAGLSVGAYLRTVALGNAGVRARRRPPLEREELGRLLGHVGKVGSNVNQLAKAMNAIGRAPGVKDIARAAADIAAIRAALMKALGYGVAANDDEAPAA